MSDKVESTAAYTSLRFALFAVGVLALQAVSALTFVVRKTLDERREAREWRRLYRKVMATRTEPVSSNPLAGMDSREVNNVIRFRARQCQTSA